MSQPPENQSANSTSLGFRILRLASKELRETLRDRRTLMTLVLMPILVYPLLSLLFQRFLIGGAQAIPVAYVFAVTSDDEGNRLGSLLNLGEDHARSVPQATVPGVSLQPTFRIIKVNNLEAAVQDPRITAGFRLLPPPDNQPRRPGTVDAEFQCLFLDEPFSHRAIEFVQSRFDVASVKLLARSLNRLQIPQSDRPLRLSLRSFGGEASQGLSLGLIVPIVLVLMTITGAVYPAIDLTAGERERGTLEMLMAAPVPRLALLLAKYLAVVTVAFLTAGINLAAMTATVMTGGLSQAVFGEQGLALTTIIEVALLLVLFVAFFSAVLLCITSFARSFKEAQAYLIPVMLLSISPSLIALLPHVELTLGTALVPLLNIVLLARNVLQGTAHFDVLSLSVVAVTILWGVAALGLASRIFGMDAILYDARVGWGELLQRPKETKPAPTLPTAWLCLALMFPACFFAAGLAARPPLELTFAAQIAVRGLATACIFGAFPLLAALLERVSLPAVLPVRRFAPLAWLGALLLGLSLWPFAHELVVFIRELGWVIIGETQFAQVQELFRQFRSVPLALVLLAFALAPGVCEEICFRGYLFGALRERLSGWQSVLLSGLAFGLFHLFATDALTVERLLPSTMLGFVLGWVRLKTGSLIPGMLLHTTHNGLLLTLFYYKDAIAKSSWSVLAVASAADAAHLPFMWLGAALAAAAAGAAMVRISGGATLSSKAGAIPSVEA